MSTSERQPAGNRWRTLDLPDAMRRPPVLRVSAWQAGNVRVISSLTMAELPDRSGVGPQWHVSVTDRGRRPKPKQVRRALRAFSMVGAEEDNHHPGNARQFWMPVDPASRVDCECKDDETTVTEPDGYAWQNDPENCRGCEYERLLGRPCPVHVDDAPPAVVPS